MIHTIVFYTLSTILIFSALMVVMQRNLFTCALYLAGTLSMVAAFFVMLGADFLAAVQMLLYVGGILVIIAFVVMLSSLQNARLESQLNQQWATGFMGALGLLCVIFIGLKKVSFISENTSYGATTRSLGHLLLKDLALPFEVVSLVLIVSLVGAVLFSRPRKGESQ
jgi:NADH-quinone oxidoreductase subunit J